MLFGQRASLAFSWGFFRWGIRFAAVVRSQEDLRPPPPPTYGTLSYLAAMMPTPEQESTAAASAAYSVGAAAASAGMAGVSAALSGLAASAASSASSCLHVIDLASHAMHQGNTAANTALSHTPPPSSAATVGHAISDSRDHAVPDNSRKQQEVTAIEDITESTGVQTSREHQQRERVGSQDSQAQASSTRSSSSGKLTSQPKQGPSASGKLTRPPQGAHPKDSLTVQRMQALAARRLARPAQQRGLLVLMSLVRSLQYLYATHGLTSDMQEQYNEVAGAMGWASFQVRARPLNPHSPYMCLGASLQLWGAEFAYI